MSPELLARVVAALESFADDSEWGYLDDSGCPRGHGDYDESWVGPHDRHPLRLSAELLREIREQSEQG